MPGRHINHQQVSLFMTLRITHTQQTAAAKAGISVASARRIEKTPRPACAGHEPRDYRTRADPLADIWDQEVVPMLEASSKLRPVTIYHELCRRFPDKIDHAVRRTIERRIRDWRAINGAERPVIFPQVQVPGRMGLSDFTDANGLGVMIAGVPLAHRLYHFAMAYSGFEHAEVVLGGESYVALASGLAIALATLGVTCTPELVPFLGRVRFSRRRTNETEQVFRRADHRDREGARSRHGDSRGLPAARR
jgi:hypothetical protein